VLELAEWGGLVVELLTILVHQHALHLLGELGRGRAPRQVERRHGALSGD